MQTLSPSHTLARKLSGLTTPRLSLRPFVQADFAAFWGYMSSPDLAFAWGGRVLEQEEQGRAMFEGFCLRGPVLAIVHLASGRVIGHVAMGVDELPDPGEQLSGRRGVSLSFAIAQNHQRQGLMTELMQQLIDFLWSEQDFDYIHCAHYDFNHKSRGLQAKLGFRFFRQRQARGFVTVDNLLLRPGLVL